jgi:hypothetical protein
LDGSAAAARASAVNAFTTSSSACAHSTLAKYNVDDR